MLMDRVGEHTSTRAFFCWVARTIQRHAWKVDGVLDQPDKGDSLNDSNYLHARYTLEGKEALSNWRRLHGIGHPYSIQLLAP